MISGIVWLIPNYSLDARSHSLCNFAQIDNTMRILRYVSPLVSIFLLIILSRIGFKIRPIFYWYLFSLFVLIVNLTTGALSFAQAGAFFIAFTCIYLVTFVQKDLVLRFIFGIAVSALFFVATSIYSFGIVSNYCYGRERFLFGFSHPVIAGASCGAVFVALFLSSVPYSLTQSLHRMKGLFRSIGLIVLLYFVFLTQSRNTLVLLLGFPLFYSMLSLFPLKYPTFIFSVCAFLGLFTLPILGKLFAGSGVWQNLDLVSSNRLTLFNDFVRNSIGSGEVIFGSQTDSSNTVSRGIDSVYLMVVASFGLFGPLLLCGLFYCFERSASKFPFRLEKAVMLAVAMYFIFDTQGLTPSNLLVFSLLLFSFSAPSNRIPMPLIQGKC